MCNGIRNKQDLVSLCIGKAVELLFLVLYKVLSNRRSLDKAMKKAECNLKNCGLMIGDLNALFLDTLNIYVGLDHSFF